MRKGGKHEIPLDMVLWLRSEGYGWTDISRVLNAWSAIPFWPKSIADAYRRHKAAL
jgi:hypothetical protein